MRSMNPVLKDQVLLRDRSLALEDRMSIQGTVHKGITCVALCFLSAMIAWQYAPQGGFIAGLAGVGGIVGFVVAMITVFKRNWAPVTAPIYSIVQGAFLGSVSLLMESRFPGIVFQAVLLTFGVTFVMLLLYTQRWVRVTDKFRIGVLAAGGAVMLIYLVGFIMSFFGTGIPYIHESGGIGIAFSLIVVGIASMFLLLDFDNIERASQAGLPKYMEWFSAFGLMVTLVWLYLEILQLLAKLQSRR